MFFGKAISGVPALKPAALENMKNVYNSHEMYFVDFCHDEISPISIK